MAHMTENQVRLLHKLQLADLPAFRDINPVTINQDEAAELFKNNLPMLEYINAIAQNEDREFVEHRFIGVTENNCKEQLRQWLDKENLTLFQPVNPYFGNGEMWLEYFAQPMKSVNLRALEDAFKRWEINVPKVPLPPGSNERRKTFSALELAFDDCPEERIEIAVANRKEQQEKEFNRVTPEQRAMIKALQGSGKAPKIDRETYLAMTRQDADKYIKEYENNPENSFESVTYKGKREITPLEEAFPQFKKINLLSHPQADYLQRSILCDLVAEGHIAARTTQEEFLSKLEYITSEQAKELIEPHLQKAAGLGLLDQCRSYIENGQIVNPKEIKTIADVQRLYQIHRGFNQELKAALRDLLEAGVIQTEDGFAKIKFTTEAQDEALIMKFGDAPIGPNLRSKIFELIEEAKIGILEDEHFKSLSVKQAMEIISTHSNLERSRRPNPATDKQKELLLKLEQRGILDLSKINMDKITFQAAHQLIEQTINTQPEQQNIPATAKQRNFIKALVSGGLLPAIPYKDWLNLTANQASQMISSVPEEKRQSLRLPETREAKARRKETIER